MYVHCYVDIRVVTDSLVQHNSLTSGSYYQLYSSDSFDLLTSQPFCEACMQDNGYTIETATTFESN